MTNQKDIYFFLHPADNVDIILELSLNNVKARQLTLNNDYT